MEGDIDVQMGVGVGDGDIDDWMIIDDESLRWIWSLDVEM